MNQGTIDCYESQGNEEETVTNLLEIIKDLIATGKEGDHWDFKSCFPHKTGDLIKDIICLANSTRHVGDRYLIYGVDDSGNIVGLPSDPDRYRTQSDIVNTLSKAGFAGGIYPDIYLQKIELQGQRLDILVIKDRPEKPYYLEKGYNKDGIRLNPGTVYSRVRDSNTSSDQVASSHDIEKMWRERFSLDQTPFQRVQNFLLDRNGWTNTSEYIWHHSQFPEFTISPTEEETRPVQADENWVRSAINPAAYVRPLQICFHQTVLAEVVCILYDEMREITSAPQPNIVDRTNNLWFFSLCADTLEFLFLRFLTGTAKDQLLQDGLSRGRLPKVPVVLFSSGEQKQAFIKDLKRDPVRIGERHDQIGGRNISAISEQDRKIIAFSEAVIERFSEWKAKES